jgi:hypothetical protein
MHGWRASQATLAIRLRRSAVTSIYQNGFQVGLPVNLT